jgi:hypothetical protein
VKRVRGPATFAADPRDFKRFLGGAGNALALQATLDAVVREHCARGRGARDAVTRCGVRRGLGVGAGHELHDQLRRVVGVVAGGRELEARARQCLGRRTREGAGEVDVVVGEVGLLGRGGVAQVRLDACVVALLALVQEDRDRDRGEDADDDDDDQELDEGEAILRSRASIAFLPKYPMSRAGYASTPSRPFRRRCRPRQPG